MKQVNLLFCFWAILLPFNGYANDPFELKVHFDNLKNEVQLGTKLEYRAYVLNNSNETVIMYDPMTKYVENRTWGLYRSDYTLYCDNDSIENLYWMVEGAGKFKRMAEVFVKPGDSLLVYKAFIQPKRVGEYQFVFKHRQIKEKYSEVVRETLGNDFNNIASFDLNSKPILFKSTLEVKEDSTYYSYEDLKKRSSDAPYWIIDKEFNPNIISKLDIKLSKETDQSLSIIPYLKNVRWIDLELKGGQDIPKEIAKLDQLVYLKINVIREKNDTTPTPNLNILKNFQKLEYLGIINTYYNEDPQWIENFTNLCFFYSQNGLKKYPLFQKLTNLQTISISGKDGQSLLPGSFDLKNLKTISLTSFATKLPDALFSKADSLTDLTISDYQSTEKIDLSNCKAKKIVISVGKTQSGYPNGMETLTDLESLTFSGDFGNTGFPDLSKSKITRLELNNKDMISLPEEIGKIKTLNWLNLTTTNLSSIDAVGACAELVRLYIYRSSLSDAISENLLNCKKMERIAIKKSGLTKFGTIAQMTFLKGIDLEENKITEIPKEIFMFKNLENLWLIKNQITSFSPEIILLPKIEQINLKENPINERQKNQYTKNISTDSKLKKLLLIDTK
jgi:Leucine-rich repeat (LRR) protein